MNLPQNINTETIRLSADGVWYHGDTEITHERTIELFFKSIYHDGDKYFLKGEKVPVPVVVDDVAYFVRSLNQKEDQYFITLSDTTSEVLDISSLDVGKDNQLYCCIKTGSARAKFERKVYHGFMSALIEKDGYFGLLINEIFYPVRSVVEAQAVEVRTQPVSLKPIQKSNLKLVSQKKSKNKLKTKKIIKTKKSKINKSKTKKLVKKNIKKKTAVKKTLKKMSVKKNNTKKAKTTKVRAKKKK